MLDSASIGMIVALVVLVSMSAYFSATETAFTSLNRIRLKNKADNGNARAAKTLALAERYDQLLSTILIGNNVVNITATTIATLLFVKLLGEVSGPTVSTIVLTVVILIFGEISPKSLAKENPETFAMFSAPLLSFFMLILTPANFLFTQWKRLLSRIFRGGESDGITEEELVTMVGQAENEGGLDEHESELIRAAIEFNDLEVEEILTPAWTSWPWRTPPTTRRSPWPSPRAATPACPSITRTSTISWASSTRRTSTPPATTGNSS